jgi:hypothetical protein
LSTHPLPLDSSLFIQHYEDLISFKMRPVAFHIILSLCVLGILGNALAKPDETPAATTTTTSNTATSTQSTVTTIITSVTTIITTKTASTTRPQSDRTTTITTTITPQPTPTDNDNDDDNDHHDDNDNDNRPSLIQSLAPTLGNFDSGGIQSISTTVATVLNAVMTIGYIIGLWMVV